MKREKGVSPCFSCFLIEVVLFPFPVFRMKTKVAESSCKSSGISFITCQTKRKPKSMAFISYLNNYCHLDTFEGGGEEETKFTESHSQGRSRE